MSANITEVQSSNTFSQWRGLTNPTSNDINEVARGDWTKSEGLFEMSNGNTTIFVSGNARTSRLYSNIFVSAANINANGYIETTGIHCNVGHFINLNSALTISCSTGQVNIANLASYTANISNTSITSIVLNGVVLDPPPVPTYASFLQNYETSDPSKDDSIYDWTTTDLPGTTPLCTTTASQVKFGSYALYTGGFYLGYHAELDLALYDDWTIEFWMKSNGSVGNQTIFSIANNRTYPTFTQPDLQVRAFIQSLPTNNALLWQLGFSDGTDGYLGGHADIQPGGVIGFPPYNPGPPYWSDDIWHHWALCKSGDIIRLFKNGTLDTANGCVATLNCAGKVLNSDYANGNIQSLTVGGLCQGWGANQAAGTRNIDGLRILAGKALYTEEFAVPTTAPGNLAVDQGAQGPQGASGSPGAAGVRGAQGATGTGVQGPQGAQGARGFQGYQGAPSSAGPQGAQGSTGPLGFSGVPGALGVQGAQGSAGFFGFQGFQGVSGGPQGVQGAQGATGNADAIVYTIGTTKVSITDPGAGWLLCDGSSVEKSVYANLFSSTEGTKLFIPEAPLVVKRGDILPNVSYVSTKGISVNQNTWIVTDYNTEANAVYKTDDFTNYTKIWLPNTIPVLAKTVHYANNIWMVSCENAEPTYNGSYVYVSSTNGATWTQIALPATDAANPNTGALKIAYGNGRWVIARTGYYPATTNTAITYTDTPLNWATYVNRDSMCGDLSGLVYSGTDSRWVALDFAGATALFYSNDGAYTWTQSGIQPPYLAYHLAKADNYYWVANYGPPDGEKMLRVDSNLTNAVEVFLPGTNAQNTETLYFDSVDGWLMYTWYDQSTYSTYYLSYKAPGSEAFKTIKMVPSPSQLPVSTSEAPELSVSGANVSIVINKGYFASNGNTIAFSVDHSALNPNTYGKVFLGVLNTKPANTETFYLPMLSAGQGANVYIKT